VRDALAKRTTVRFGGFGGQGIVLSSVVLGLAAVHDGKYVCQRASYGSEARGGRCKSEVIISDEEISYPLIDDLQILVIMSKQALDQYIGELSPKGLLIVDPDMTDEVKRKDITVLKIPAALTADKLGNRIIANMILLGALQAETGVVTKKSLQKAMKESVADRFVDLNLNAFAAGEELQKTLSGDGSAGSRGQ
jgi:2-oxoglutarate ferredoxin oxidoreductase subunit gamma